MIRMHQFRSAQEMKNYYTAALEGGDYYIDAERDGRWCGSLRDRLGMSEAVDKESFARLCDNEHPTTQERLTPRTDVDRTVGYDINFHVPKSVTVLHLATQDERIVDAIRSATHETMLEIERQASTRVRVQGKDEERPTGSLVWGEFVHTTTRPVKGKPDPHLHVHCVVFNATFDPVEQRIKAAQFRDIKRDMPYHEAAFYSRLTWRLQDLGYDIERKGKEWGIAGISRSICNLFSRRTEEIESLAQRLNIRDPERKAGLGARSRARKDKDLPPEKVKQEWKERLTVEQWQAIKDKARSRPIERGDERANAIAALEMGIAHRFERESVVAEPRLLESALRFSLGKVRPEMLKEVAANHPELLRKREAGQDWATTRAVLAEEERMLAFARDGRGTCPALEGDRPCEPGSHNLNRQQRAAVEHLLQSQDRVMLLRGGAGTGKTSLLKAAAAELRSRGISVLTMAPTAEASRGVLRQAGFKEAETVAKFLADPATQRAAKNGVLWVDEAGLLGTKSLNMIFQAAHAWNARVVLSGDTRQHSPVEPGDAMRLLEERVGLRPAEVSQVVRQQGTYREAVEAMSRGAFDRGVTLLDQMGAIQELPGKDWVPLVMEYLECVRQGRSALVIAPTHAEGQQISGLIRAGLKRSGSLDQRERLMPQVKDLRWSESEKADSTRYEAGQVVQFHRAVKSGRDRFAAGSRLRVAGHDDQGRVLLEDKDGGTRVLPLKRAASFGVNEERWIGIAKGESIRLTGGGRTVDGKHRLNNGGLHRVTGFTPQGHIKLDNGWTIGRDFGRIDHAYVSTSHAAQGKTVDWVYVAQGWGSAAAASAEQVYVSVSRGRTAVRIYTDDRAALIDAIRRLSARRSAVELMEPSSPADRSRQHAQVLTRLRMYEKRRQQGRPKERQRERGGYER
jgi:conjugative relaxase-like TrwC/TraI family protein